jgi:cobalt-zinc-cadmium efflux system outer membrane protein
MRWRSAAALALLASSPVLAQQAQPPALANEVTLEQVLEIVATSPRISAASREAEAARFDRRAAGAYPNPSLTFGSSRPSGGERTIFDADRQSQTLLEVPLPVFGQMGARERAADRQATLADTQFRLATIDIRKQAALSFTRLLGAQEQLGARRAELVAVERIRGLVTGRMESGMASRYDLARANAEGALAALALQRAETAVSEQSAALAALVDDRAWRPRAAGSLDVLAAAAAPLASGDDAVERSPALRAAREEAAAAEARIELAQRELLPVPSVQLGRTWTSGPFGAANYVGIGSEIPISSDRRSLIDKAKAQAMAARDRERATGAALRAEYRRQVEALGLRREALARFDRDVYGKQSAFLEMAESSYRLGRGSLFELLDAHRTLVEAIAARTELIGAIAESQIELRALGGEL